MTVINRLFKDSKVAPVFDTQNGEEEKDSLYIFRIDFLLFSFLLFSFSGSEPLICVETMKLDLISDFLLPLLPEINGVWTNLWNSFISVYYNYNGCT